MIVRDLNFVRAAGNEIHSDGWTSRRYLLKKDGMGFSFHQTIIKSGVELAMHYKNHLEAVFCMSGKGEILGKATGERHPIGPGVMYALNLHDEHVLVAHSEMTMMCVFNPPVVGDETHKADGSYELVNE